jgi:hypothetical protein
MNPLLYGLAIAVAAAAVTTGAAAQTPLEILQSLDAAAQRESTDFAGLARAEMQRRCRF